MKVVIFCGGRGTRIKDLSGTLPKPMLPIGDKPILWHIMKTYSCFGFTEFILCLGYKGWMIKDFFLNYHAKTSDITLELGKNDAITYHSKSEEDHWKITLAETGEDSGTASRLWTIRKYLENENMFSVTYGDGVADIDIKALLETHGKSALLGTLSGVHPEGRFGELIKNGDTLVSFHEKPNVSPSLVNGGFMVFNTSLFDRYTPINKASSLEIEILPKMVNEHQLACHEHRGFWQCVDTPREFDLLNTLWATGNAPWKIW